VIAAISPAKITSIIILPAPGVVSIISGFTVLATVSATPWSLKTKNATELNRAAHNTAWKGVSTLVDTTVAMELAAS